MRFMTPQIGIGVGAASGHGLKGEQRDKLGGRLGQNRVHLRTGLAQFARQISRLVTSNTARDAEQNTFALDRVHRNHFYVYV